MPFLVYADSASTDDSVDIANSFGVEVVPLDAGSPFTAARGRNAGFYRLLELFPGIEYVQFIDGDCVLNNGWVEAGVHFLEGHPRHAVVCGLLQEKFPAGSVYNRLCDIEWQGPVGDIDACGGVFMVRVSAFAEIGGMDSAITAGEEPEMCLRLRQRGWKVARIDAEMAKHDADMIRFSQWWKRSMRSGSAYAQGYLLQGLRGGQYCRRDVLRISFWGLWLPVFATTVGLVVNPAFFALFFLYPLLLIKVALQKNKQLHNIAHSFLYSYFNILGKFPQVLGLLGFLKKRLLQQ